MITPYIAVPDSQAALDFYRRALGAEVTTEPQVMDDGTVGHCAFRVFGSEVMMSDAYPDLGVVTPDATGVPVTLYLQVPDCDAATDTMAAAGATVDRSPSDNPYGRTSVLRDPFGHRWMLGQAPA